MRLENIKFKAKRLDSKQWVKGSLIEGAGGKKYIVTRFSSMSDYSVVGVDPFTVCQYTGVKDYDGNEIWEHDLIDNTPYWHRVNTDEREICEVTFHRGSFCIEYADGSYETLMGCCSTFNKLLGSDKRRIGSKFDKEVSL